VGRPGRAARATNARRIDGVVRTRRRLSSLPSGYLIAAAVLPLLLLALWGGLLLGRGLGAGGATVGSRAPDFALADLEGNPFRLADHRGRPVVVNFWASWCGPCVEEFPLLRDTYERHRDEGLTMIGVVVEDNSESARAFMTQLDATWAAAMDPGGRVAERYGIFGPPETFFVARDGTVVARQIGQLSAASLDEKVAAILEE
jgi:cytochrome c biogenesis protein CcmG/thiol:disulfide interchange protein DsbE